jgi:hypothetical protein
VMPGNSEVVNHDVIVRRAADRHLRFAYRDLLDHRGFVPES